MEFPVEAFPNPRSLPPEVEVVRNQSSCVNVSGPRVDFVVVAGAWVLPASVAAVSLDPLSAPSVRKVIPPLTVMSLPLAQSAMVVDPAASSSLQ